MPPVHGQNDQNEEIRRENERFRGGHATGKPSDGHERSDYIVRRPHFAATAIRPNPRLQRPASGCLDGVDATARSTRPPLRRILDALRAAPFDDLGFARVDTPPSPAAGFPEVVFGLGKTPAQIAAIAERIVVGRALAARHAHDARRVRRRARRCPERRRFMAKRARSAGAGRDRPRARHHACRVRRHVRPSGRRRGGGHGGAHGQHGRPALRRRASPGCIVCSASMTGCSAPAS